MPEDLGSDSKDILFQQDFKGKHLRISEHLKSTLLNCKEWLNLGETDLSEKKGIYEKAKEEMRLSERVLAELPGFKGYKEKELRRGSDRLIRDHLYQRLMEARKDMKEVFQMLSDSHLHEVLTEMDRFLARFDRISEKINHASYGYAGFFNIVKVEEDKLDKMIEFDTNLLGEVEKIVEDANTFKREAAKQQFEGVRDHISSLNDKLEMLEETFDGREEVIMGVK